MKANAAETYVLTKTNDKAPQWFYDETSAGRIRLFYEDDELTHASVFYLGKTMRANIGDTIMRTKNGISVLTKEQARKYKVSGR